MKTTSLFLAAAVLCACGGSPAGEHGSPPKNTFVLVSGSWHGAWCWEKVVDELSVLGQDAIAVELPAHGSDTTPLKDITLDGYVKAVCDSIARAGRKVVLVGHSRGGIVISQSAEACPENIARLVYLAAFLIPDGDAMLRTALGDTGSLLVRNLELDTVAGWHMPRKEAIAEAFYHDCPPDDIAAASARLTREPNAPVGTPLHLTRERYGSIPRTYIKTLDDRALTPAAQERMLAAQPCDTVFSLATGHSPMISRPKELAEMLVRIAGR